MSDSLELYEQAPLLMEFTRQEYWSGLPCLLQGNLPHLGIKPKSFKSPALTGGFFTTSAEYLNEWEVILVFRVSEGSMWLRDQTF